MESLLQDRGKEFCLGFVQQRTTANSSGKQTRHQSNMAAPHEANSWPTSPQHRKNSPPAHSNTLDFITITFLFSNILEFISFTNWDEIENFPGQNLRFLERILRFFFKFKRDLKKFQIFWDTLYYQIWWLANGEESRLLASQTNPFHGEHTLSRNESACLFAQPDERISAHFSHICVVVLD